MEIMAKVGISFNSRLSESGGLRKEQVQAPRPWLSALARRLGHCDASGSLNVCPARDIGHPRRPVILVPRSASGAHSYQPGYSLVSASARDLPELVGDLFPGRRPAAAEAARQAQQDRSTTENRKVTECL
jgi:hypothetical protein